MASYHLEAKIIGRSEGRSAVAAAAYRSGAAIAGADGRTHDYSRKGGVIAAQIVAPDDAPEWALDRPSLWNAVEARETRKNSRLSREIVVALPNEMTHAEALVLLTDWARDQIAARGIVADVCVHDPHPSGPERSRNMHAHIMTTLRRFDPERPDGWSKDAARDLNDVSFIEDLRASWAEAQNRALAESGSDARVDHRSLSAQRDEALDHAAAAAAAGDDALADVYGLAAAALDRPPEPRLGVSAGAVDRKAGAVVSTRGRALIAARSLRDRLYGAVERARDAIIDARAAVVEIAGRALPPAPPPLDRRPDPPDDPDFGAPSW